jgi:hypothetical protein
MLIAVLGVLPADTEVLDRALKNRGAIGRALLLADGVAGAAHVALGNDDGGEG